MYSYLVTTRNRNYFVIPIGNVEYGSTNIAVGSVLHKMAERSQSLHGRCGFALGRSCLFCPEKSILIHGTANLLNNVGAELQILLCVCNCRQSTVLRNSATKTAHPGITDGQHN